MTQKSHFHFKTRHFQSLQFYKSLQAKSEWFKWSLQVVYFSTTWLLLKLYATSIFCMNVILLWFYFFFFLNIHDCSLDLWRKWQFKLRHLSGAFSCVLVRHSANNNRSHVVSWEIHIILRLRGHFPASSVLFFPLLTFLRITHSKWCGVRPDGWKSAESGP